MKLPTHEARTRLGAQVHGVLCTLHPERGPDAQPVVYAVSDDGEVGRMNRLVGGAPRTAAAKGDGTGRRRAGACDVAGSLIERPGHGTLRADASQRRAKAAVLRAPQHSAGERGCQDTWRRTRSRAARRGRVTVPHTHSAATMTRTTFSSSPVSGEPSAMMNAPATSTASSPSSTCTNLTTNSMRRRYAAGHQGGRHRMSLPEQVRLCAAIDRRGRPWLPTRVCHRWAPTVSRTGVTGFSTSGQLMRRR